MDQRLTYSFSPKLAPEDREAIEREMTKKRRRAKPRPHDPARARAALEARGERNLTAPMPEVNSEAKTIVRVFYRSEGDEILAMDSVPMTARAAIRYADTFRRTHALGATLYEDNAPAGGGWGQMPTGARVATVPAPTWHVYESALATITPIASKRAPVARFRGAGAWTLRTATFAQRERSAA